MKGVYPRVDFVDLAQNRHKPLALSPSHVLEDPDIKLSPSGKLIDTSRLKLKWLRKKGEHFERCSESLR